MNKFWFTSAVLLGLGSNLLADSISNSSTGSLYAMPSTASFTASMTAYTGGPVNAANTQVPFWNNPSEDVNFHGHYSNVGDVLAGVATNTNLIGSDLTGTTGTLAGDLATQVNGAYYASAGGSNPVNSAAPTVSGGVVSETSALEFTFMSAATAYNIAVLFAESSEDTGVAGRATSFGTYVGNTDGSLILNPLDAAVAYNSGTPQTISTDAPIYGESGTIYGFYATVCYTYVNGVCTASITYTTGAGNYSTNISADGANSYWLGGLGYNHFALFELASGAEVLGFKDYPWALGSANDREGIGDYNDLVVELVDPPTATPEPDSIALMAVGIASLLLASRRRVKSILCPKSNASSTSCKPATTAPRGTVLP